MSKILNCQENGCELYYGCHACGHETTPGQNCWECEHDRHLAWLNELGEYPTPEQWLKHEQHQKAEAKAALKPKKEKTKMKLWLKAEMLFELTALRYKLVMLNRRVNKIQKQIQKLNKTWNHK